MLRGNTNWNLYKTFIAVYETENMRKASNILGITRAAVSHNIKVLGDQLGIVLFSPHGKGVSPTSDASSIYPIVKAAVESLIHAESIASKLNYESKAIIKMAVSNTSVEILLESYLEEFCAKYPKIRLKIAKLEGMDLFTQKQQDFIIDLKHCINHSLKTIDLYTVNNTFFATKDFLKKHGLSNTISKEQLFKLPIIVRKGGVWTIFSKQIDTRDIPSIPVSAVTKDMVYSMTKKSIGVGFLSKELLKLLHRTKDHKLVALKVKDITIPKLQFSCGYHENLTKPACSFVEGFQKFCQETIGRLRE